MANLTVERVEVVKAALALLVERVKARAPVHWYNDPDLRGVREKYSLSRAEAGVVTRKLGEIFGPSLDKRREYGEELGYLIEVLRETGGEFTEEAHKLMKEKFPTLAVGGPLIYAARIRLGLRKSRTEVFKEKKGETTLPIPSEFKDALAAMEVVKRLTAKVGAIEEQIEALEEAKRTVQKELEVYKPVLATMRSLSTAVASLRSNAGASQ